MVLHYVGDWWTAWTEQDKNTIKNQKSETRMWLGTWWQRQHTKSENTIQILLPSPSPSTSTPTPTPTPATTTSAVLLCLSYVSISNIVQPQHYQTTNC